VRAACCVLSSPNPNPNPNHTHTPLSFFGTQALDSAFLRYTLDRVLPAAYSTSTTRGGGVHLLFAFEAVVLASGGLGAAAKAGLAAVDAAAGGAWEGRGPATFYIDLATDLLHLTGYAAFFAAVAAGHGLPLHLLRDVWWTARSLRDRARSFLAYRAASAGLEARLADADAEDLARCGGVCIVCREEMGAAGGGGGAAAGQAAAAENGGGAGGAPPQPPPRPPPRIAPAGPRAKRLPCGHAFHVRCLRSWLERQQACPICRAPVMGEAAPAAPAAAAAAPPPPAAGAAAAPAPAAAAAAAADPAPAPDAPDGLRHRRPAGAAEGAPAAAPAPAFAGPAAAAAAAAGAQAPAAPAATPAHAAAPAPPVAAPAWPAGPFALFFPLPPGTPAPPGGWAGAAGLSGPAAATPLPPGVGAVALAPGLHGGLPWGGGGFPAALVPPAAWTAAGAAAAPPAAPAAPAPPAAPPAPAEPEAAPPAPAPPAPPPPPAPAAAPADPAPEDDLEALRRARLERLGG